MLYVPCFSRTLTISDFGYSDPNDDPSNDPFGVKIINAPFFSLTDSGSPVTPGQLISYADLAAGKLVYTAGFTPSLATIDFQIQDSGGTANGGIDLDPSVHTLALGIYVGILSSPQGIDHTITAAEDAAYGFGLPGFPLLRYRW